ncbi:LysR family transcriptional regulator [Kibdelosporangium lantanae]
MRQLRYFVAVADELHFGRAAARLLIAGPSLSQQIKALERDLGLRLFERDNRSVALTAAGAALLPHARALLDRADDLRDRAARLAGSEPVRLGYVQWLPPDLTARTSPAAQLLVDPWVVPSHTQAERVADGALDLAVCWTRQADLDRLGLAARLIGGFRLYAVSTGVDSGPVRAADVIVPVDEDTTSWSSWNVFAEEYARDVGARVWRVNGVTGPAYFEHVRVARRPVLNSPRARTCPCRRIWCSGRWSARPRCGSGSCCGGGTRHGQPCSPRWTPSPPTWVTPTATTCGYRPTR